MKPSGQAQTACGRASQIFSEASLASPPSSCTATCPAARGWIKTKNRDYGRYPLEVEAALAGR